jgi:hypothetical protein
VVEAVELMFIQEVEEDLPLPNAVSLLTTRTSGNRLRAVIAADAYMLDRFGCPGPDRNLRLH